MYDQKISEAEREARVKQEKINELTKMLKEAVKEDDVAKQY